MEFCCIEVGFMKQEQGLVMDVEGRIARVKVGRHEECTGCGACPSSRHVTVDAVNDLGAKPGQRVRFEMREEQVLLGAFVVFLLPLLSAGLGALFGWQMSLALGMEETVGTVAGAAVFFLMSLLGVKLFDRRAAKNQQMKPVIIEIL